MHVSIRRVGSLLVVLVALSASPALGAVRDPLPEQAIQSGLGLQLKPFTRLPRSETYPAPPVDARLVRYNRINYIGEVPDGSGRMYVPDLNGTLYLVDERAAARLPRRRRRHSSPSSSPAAAWAGLRLRRPSTPSSRERPFYTVHTGRPRSRAGRRT